MAFSGIAGGGAPRTWTSTVASSTAPCGSSGRDDDAQALSYVPGYPEYFEIASAGAVSQWTLRVAAGVEHAAGHAAATGFRSDLVRR